jgi:hypothetical protein
MKRKATALLFVGLMVTVLLVAVVSALSAASDPPRDAQFPVQSEPVGEPRLPAQNTPPLPAEKPVNGLFYGDGDYLSGRYEIVGYSPPLTTGVRTRATMYRDRDASGWLYFALVVDRSVNDNVFGNVSNNQPDRAYLDTAGWGSAKHDFGQLWGSDHMMFKMSCISPTQVFTWYHGYIYAEGNASNPTRLGPWLSGPGDGSTGGGNPPPTLVSASSLMWNMNKAVWDVTLGGARTEYNTWKSPATNGAADTSVIDELGYPPPGVQYTDNITFNKTYSWEWPLVYEFAFYWPEVCNIPPAFDLLVIGAHNSPSKDGDEDVPLAVDLAYFTAKGSAKKVVLEWATTRETNNVGFNLYRAMSLDEVRTLVNKNIIPSGVSPAGGGAVYRFTDAGLEKKTTYFYWLQDVPMDGKSGLSQPLEVRTK